MTDLAPQRWQVPGHEWAVEFLRKGMQHRRNRHAYLITGMEGIGKADLARTFAMALNCADPVEGNRPCGVCRSCKLTISENHPDLLFGEADETSERLKIEAIREVTRTLALKPFESRYRIAVFPQFDRADPRTQDALLKTLEEPPAHAVLILMATSTENIMPTILSRCQHLPLRPVPQETVQRILEEGGVPPDKALLLARFSGGRIRWALEAAANDEVLRERDAILNRLQELLSGNRRARFELAEELDQMARKDRAAIRQMLEIWLTYWRDATLLAMDSPIKPCNTDRSIELQQLVQRIQPDEALHALQATRAVLREQLNTNANVRLMFEVLFLDYPLLSR